MNNFYWQTYYHFYSFFFVVVAVKGSALCHTGRRVVIPIDLNCYGVCSNPIVTRRWKTAVQHDCQRSLRFRTHETEQNKNKNTIATKQLTNNNNNNSETSSHSYFCFLLKIYFFLSACPCGSDRWRFPAYDDVLTAGRSKRGNNTADPIARCCAPNAKRREARRWEVRSATPAERSFSGSNVNRYSLTTHTHTQCSILIDQFYSGRLFSFLFYLLNELIYFVFVWHRCGQAIFKARSHFTCALLIRIELRIGQSTTTLYVSTPTENRKKKSPNPARSSDFDFVFLENDTIGIQSEENWMTLRPRKLLIDQVFLLRHTLFCGSAIISRFQQSANLYNNTSQNTHKDLNWNQDQTNCCATEWILFISPNFVTSLDGPEIPDSFLWLLRIRIQLCVCVCWSSRHGWCFPSTSPRYGQGKTKEICVLKEWVEEGSPAGVRQRRSGSPAASLPTRWGVTF